MSNANTSTLYKVRTLLVKAVDTNKTAIVGMLNGSGIKTSVHDTKAKIQEQVVKGLAVSKNFKEKLQNYLAANHKVDISKLVGSYPTNGAPISATKNFVTQPLYMNSLTVESSYQPTTDPHGFLPVNSFFPETPPVKATVYQNATGDPTTASAQPTGILGWLNTALGVYTTTVQNNVANEQQKLVAAQSQAQVAQANASQSWVLPVTLGIAVVGAGVAVWYFKFHKK